MSVFDRVNRAIGKTENPIVCTRCGSTHFYVVQVEQWAETSYAADRSLSLSPVPVKICLCGMPYQTPAAGFRGRAMTEETQKFVDSMKAAQAVNLKVNELDPQKMLDQIAGKFATPADLKTLEDKLTLPETTDNVQAKGEPTPKADAKEETVPSAPGRKKGH